MRKKSLRISRENPGIEGSKILSSAYREGHFQSCIALPFASCRSEQHLNFGYFVFVCPIGQIHTKSNTASRINQSGTLQDILAAVETQLGPDFGSGGTLYIQGRVEIRVAGKAHCFAEGLGKAPEAVAVPAAAAGDTAVGFGCFLTGNGSVFFPFRRKGGRFFVAIHQFQLCEINGGFAVEGTVKACNHLGPAVCTDDGEGLGGNGF